MGAQSLGDQVLILTSGNKRLLIHLQSQNKQKVYENKHSFFKTKKQMDLAL